MGLAASRSASLLVSRLPSAVKAAEAAQTLGAIAGGVLVYLSLAALLRMDEVRFLWGLRKAKLSSKRGAGQEG